MKTIVSCKHCYKEIEIKVKCESRWELAERKGKQFDIQCPRCKNNFNYSVDEVLAKAGLINTIAIILLFAIIPIDIWLLYPYASKGIISIFILPIGVLAPALVFAVFMREENRRIKSFNSTRPNSLKTIKFSKKF